MSAAATAISRQTPKGSQAQALNSSCGMNIGRPSQCAPTAISVIARSSRPMESPPAAAPVLQRHPLIASAALVRNGDLPRPPQQMLFDTADSMTEATHAQPADLISLTTA